MRQGVFLMPWVLIALPMFIGGIVSGEAGLFVAAMMMSLIYAPLVYGVCVYTRLIISPEGVDLRQMGFRLQSSWDNIEALDRTPGQEGFVLREPMEGKGAVRLANTSGVRIVVSGAAMPAYTGGRQDLVAQLRFIPIEPFAYWMKKGDLGDVISHFAPRLIDGQPIPPRIVAPPMPLKAKILTGVLIGGSLTLGVLLAGHHLSPAAELWAYRILNGAIIVALAGYSFVNLAYVWLHVRQRKWGWACMSLIFALLAIGGFFAAVGSMP